MMPDTEEFRRVLIELAKMEAKIDATAVKLAELEAQQRELVGQINRWKGAVPVFLGVGAALAWILTQGKNIKEWLT